MVIGLLIAASMAIVAGLLAIVYGFMLELSFGNTLIQAGTFGVCSGLIIMAQAAVVKELRNLGRQLRASQSTDDLRYGPDFGKQGPAVDLDPMVAPAAADEDDEPFPAETGEVASARPPLGAPPWRDAGPPRNWQRPRPSETPDAEDEAVPPKRRNLMFSSSMRKETDRTPTGGLNAGSEPPVVGDAGEASAPWRRSDDLRPSEMMAQRRAARAALAEGRPGPIVPEPPETPGPLSESAAEPVVTVIKSGVVDGMGYSLYSDGSIEAQLPEGMMRFASIDELREHLDGRS